MELQQANSWARRNLRSASSSVIITAGSPYTRLSTIGDRAFPVAAVCVCNGLPHHVLSAFSRLLFHSRLKSYLSRHGFPHPILFPVSTFRVIYYPKHRILTSFKLPLIRSFYYRYVVINSLLTVITEKMCACLCTYSVPWQPRLRHNVKLEPRYTQY